VLGDACLPWLGVLAAAGDAVAVALVLGWVLAWRNERARLADTLRSY
jgi:uncharacterized membrane protein (DUF4010 family)